MVHLAYDTTDKLTLWSLICRNRQICPAFSCISSCILFPTLKKCIAGKNFTQMKRSRWKQTSYISYYQLPTTLLTSFREEYEKVCSLSFCGFLASHVNVIKGESTVVSRSLWLGSFECTMNYVEPFI